MAYKVLPPIILAIIFLILYFLGIMGGFLLNTLAVIFFVLPGIIGMALLSDEWKNYGLFILVVGIVLIVL